MAENINSLNPSRWHKLIKLNFPFFQESLIVNSFLPDLKLTIVFLSSKWGCCIPYNLCNAVRVSWDGFYRHGL